MLPSAREDESWEKMERFVPLAKLILAAGDPL
jgi:hypothetical protein